MILDTKGSRAFRTSGEFKIQAKGGLLSDWTDITNLIIAPESGDILSDADNNPQTLDETIFIPGQTFSFRMYDVINLLYSNIIHIAIPSEKIVTATGNNIITLSGKFLITAN